MKTISGKIQSLVTAARPVLMKMSPATAGRKASPSAWSKKEILGHLIDSAANNHQRIVRAAQNAALDFPPYNQNRWVEVQHYDEMDWTDLVEFFSLFNYHLCRVIDALPPEVQGNPCNIGREAPVMLKFIIEDYFRHLEHHMSQILNSPA